MTAHIPHRFIPDSWPEGHSWNVTYAIASTGYVTRVSVEHRRSRDPNGRPIRPTYGRAAFSIGAFEDVLDITREAMLAAAVDSSEQATLF